MGTLLREGTKFPNTPWHSRKYNSSKQIGIGKPVEKDDLIARLGGVRLNYFLDKNGHVKKDMVYFMKEVYSVTDGKPMRVSHFLSFFPLSKELENGMEMPSYTIRDLQDGIENGDLVLMGVGDDFISYNPRRLGWFLGLSRDEKDTELKYLDNLFKLAR